MTTTRLLKGVSPYTRLLLATALPVALQTLLLSSKAFVDVLLLGLVDTDSVAAAGLSGRLVVVVIVLLASLAAGGGYVSSQCAHSPDKLAATTTLTLGVTTVAALLAMGFMNIIHDALLGLSTTDETILRLAWCHLSIISLTFPMIGLSSVMGSFLRIRGGSRKVFVISIFGLIINVLSTLLLIVLLDYGIAGAAWGTLLGALAEIVLLAWRVAPERRLFWTRRNITRRQLSLITTQAVLTGLGSLTWALGAFVFYALLGRTSGDVLYILAILTPLESLLLSFALGLSLASGIELGKRIPTQSPADIYAKARLSPMLSLVITLALVTTVLLAYWSLSFLFISVKAITGFEPFLLLMLLAILLKSISIQLINGIIRCGGDARFCLWLDGCTQWGLILPSAWLLVTMGVPGEGVYAVVLVEEVIKIMIAGWRFKSDRWRRNLAAEC